MHDEIRAVILHCGNDVARTTRTAAGRTGKVEAWLAANEVARRALVAPMIDPIISRIFITDARVGNEGDTQCA
jgi:predicted protein tyrosine phosphatase